MIFCALKLEGAEVKSQAVLCQCKSNILSWICTLVLMHSSYTTHTLICMWISCLNASSCRHIEATRKLPLADIPLPLLFHQGQNDRIFSGGGKYPSAGDAQQRTPGAWERRGLSWPSPCA